MKSRSPTRGPAAAALPVLLATALSGTVLSNTGLSAQGIDSGPEPGMKLSPVKVYASSGPYKGKEFDAVAEIGKGPGALLFVHELTRETAPMIRTLDTQAAAARLLGFHAFVVFLSGDRTFAEQRIQVVSNALNMVNPMTVSLDGAEGPGNYALNRNATLTLVMAKDGVVTKSIGFTDTGPKDAPRVVAAIEAVAGRLPKTQEERDALLPDDPQKLKDLVRGMWQENAALRAQLAKILQANMRNRGRRNMQGRQPGRQQGREMRRGGERDRDRAKKPLPAAIPEDPKMESLLRRLIHVRTTDEIDALFAAVDKLVGQDAAKRKQMADGFTRILKATTYGTDEARKRAQAWCDAHGKPPARRARRD